jgi:hypothetical protein
MDSHENFSMDCPCHPFMNSAAKKIIVQNKLLLLSHVREGAKKSLNSHQNIHLLAGQKV